MREIFANSTTEGTWVRFERKRGNVLLQVNFLLGNTEDLNGLREKANLEMTRKFEAQGLGNAKEEDLL